MIFFVVDKNIVTNPCYGKGSKVDIDEAVAVVESPNFPDLYPNRARCRWHIVGDRANFIELTFLEFELEEGLVQYQNIRLQIECQQSRIVTNMPSLSLGMICLQ